ASTSLSSALNFLPHHVRSAFQLSIRPPSRRIKRKFPCCAHAGTFSGLARYRFAAGSKGSPELSRNTMTNPISPMLFAPRTRCRVLSFRNYQEHRTGHIVGASSSRQHRFPLCAWSGMRRQGGPLRTPSSGPVNVALRVHPEASTPVEKSDIAAKQQHYAGL